MLKPASKHESTLLQSSWHVRTFRVQGAGMVGERCVWRSFCKRCNLPGSWPTAAIRLETSYLTWTVLAVFAVPLSVFAVALCAVCQSVGPAWGWGCTHGRQSQSKTVTSRNSGATRHMYTQLLRVEKRTPYEPANVSRFLCSRPSSPPL